MSNLLIINTNRRKRKNCVQCSVSCALTQEVVTNITLRFAKSKKNLDLVRLTVASRGCDMTECTLRLFISLRWRRVIHQTHGYKHLCRKTISYMLSDPWLQALGETWPLPMAGEQTFLIQCSHCAARKRMTQHSIRDALPQHQLTVVVELLHL